MDYTQLKIKATPSVKSILRFYPDDVEDVMQNALTKYIRFESGWRGQGQVSTWFVRIAINEALMFLRQRRVKFDKQIDLEHAHEVRDDGPSPETLTIRADTRARLQKEIDKLSPSRRSAVEQFLKTGYVGSNGRNKSLFFRAKHDLARSFEKQGVVLSYH